MTSLVIPCHLLDHFDFCRFFFEVCRHCSWFSVSNMLCDKKIVTFNTFIVFCISSGLLLYLQSSDLCESKLDFPKFYLTFFAVFYVIEFKLYLYSFVKRLFATSYIATHRWSQSRRLFIYHTITPHKKPSSIPIHIYAMISQAYLSLALSRLVRQCLRRGVARRDSN